MHGCERERCRRQVQVPKSTGGMEPHTRTGRRKGKHRERSWNLCGEWKGRKTGTRAVRKNGGMVETELKLACSDAGTPQTGSGGVRGM